MLVSLSPSFNQIKKVNDTKCRLQSIPLTKSLPKDNVSFGSVSLSTIALVARSAAGIPKNIKFTQLVSEIAQVIKNPNLFKNELPDALGSLGKVPDNISGLGFALVAGFRGKETWGNIVTASSDLIVPDLRLSATRILSLANDDSHMNIQSKKDFIRSLFTNGYDISEDFFEQFKKLSDIHYKSFKEEVIDTCLYSKEYASKRHMQYVSYVFDPPSPKKNEFLLKNMALIDTLDEKRYSDYIRNNYDEIIARKKILLNAAVEHLMLQPEKILKLIENDFTCSYLYYGGSEFHTPYKYYGALFDGQFKNCNGDISKLAQVFNVDKSSLEKAMAERTININKRRTK